MDPKNDIAVLRLTNGTGFSDKALSSLPKPIDVGNSPQVLIGQTVMAVGNYLGMDRSLTSGVVSAKEQECGFQGSNKCFVIDGELVLSALAQRLPQRTKPPYYYPLLVPFLAVMRAGSSGGPLLDSQGRLIGVLVGVFAETPALGIAVAIDTVASFVDGITEPSSMFVSLEKPKASRWWKR